MDTTKVANTNGTTPATPKKPSRAGAVATWADERLGPEHVARSLEAQRHGRARRQALEQIVQGVGMGQLRAIRLEQDVPGNQRRKGAANPAHSGG